MQASAQWIFAFGNRSLKALQVIIITCFAVTLIICFYASALFWFKVFSPPAPPLRTVGYCFIGTSCRFSTFIPSSLLMVYLIQSLHSCFIFITNSFPCSRTLGKKERKKSPWDYHGIFYHPFALSPFLPYAWLSIQSIPVGTEGCAVLSLYCNK